MTPKGERGICHIREKTHDQLEIELGREKKKLHPIGEKKAVEKRGGRLNLTKPPRIMKLVAMGEKKRPPFVFEEEFWHASTWRRKKNWRGLPRKERGGKRGGEKSNSTWTEKKIAEESVIRGYKT